MASIMYVCQDCEEQAPEGCGHFYRNELRVVPATAETSEWWLCQGCCDERPKLMEIEDMEESDTQPPDAVPNWADMKPPPKYVPASTESRETDNG